MDNNLLAECSAAVKQVIDRFGIDILSEHKRFCAALSDFAPKLSKENKAFFVALSENIGIIFIREHNSVMSGSHDPDKIIQRAATDISEYLNDEKAQLVSKSIAVALGWITLEAPSENKNENSDIPSYSSSSSLIEDLFKRAQNGDNDACFNLGECFFYGRGVKQDYSKAVKWYIQSSDRGDCSSQKKLADCYYLGQGTERNVAKAAFRYEQAAEQGDYDSQKALIRCYLKGGNGLFPDPARAEFYSKRYNITISSGTPNDIMKNAQDGDLKSQFRLGNMYLHGTGIEHSPEKAIQWFKKAAEKDYPPALYNLAYCYQHGIGVPVDRITAAVYYKKAADNGDLDALNNLAGCCMRGEGTVRDQNIAAKYYKKAAESGHAKAQYNYGECCFKGMGIAKNLSEAVHWYKSSAEQGDPDGQYSYGWCLRDGIGTAQDPITAKEMFELAAAQRHAPAQKALGYCYVNGTGTAKNFAVAAEQFAKAAVSGDKEAAELLAACYKYGGEYLAVNDAKAHYYADQYDIDYDKI
ncbi:MAG: sel1 repeat family protein [Ruminococcus sp.]|uniref:SEL1-like repeat protein n=1 Tax=Ruminococcus sp. TaxID=41978 RepID=UPI0025EFF2CC|nr:tetratricopeptide repeat protein [Ruminococcus sp.]MCR5600980.1 sel1 repeat family protein [Ruminococcus sp.]